MFAPPRLLSIRTSSISNATLWTENDPNDPWINYPYQWTVTFSVTAQAHSYPNTSTPYYYTGNDVKVGDWFADISTGSSVRIVSISSQNPSSVTCIAEDVDRFNTFTDPTQQGTGIGPSGAGFLFQIGEDGLPILGPMSTLFTALAGNLAWQMDQISRFRYRNLTQGYVSVAQANNGFAIGDVIYLQSNGQYALVDPNNATTVQAIGVVNSVGVPGTEYFSYRPVGRVVSNVTLPGQPGDLIYAGSSGSYSSAVPPVFAKPMYIQIDASSAIALDRNIETPADRNGYITQTSVVPTTADMSSVASPQPGDQVLVENDGTGEWVHYLRHSDGTWKVLVTEEASHVDAETLEGTVTAATGSSLILGDISESRCVTLITVTVTAPFTSASTISVGTASDNTLLLNNDQIDLTTVGTYSVNPNATMTAPLTQILAYAAIASGDTGSAEINLTYT